MKEMFNCWDAYKLFESLLESGRLEHENDGLIFTIDDCPYYPGTCEQIFKWKPIELNSIDFRIEHTQIPFVSKLLTQDLQLFGFVVLDNDQQYEAGAVVECVFDKSKDS